MSAAIYVIARCLRPRAAAVALCWAALCGASNISPPSCAVAPSRSCYHGQTLEFLPGSASWQACCSACGSLEGCTTYEFKHITRAGSERNACKLYNASAHGFESEGCLSGSSAVAPAPSPTPPHDHPPRLADLVPNRFGPYVKEIQSEMSKEYPFISGYGSGACYWGKVEPENGRFNFTLCRSAIEQAHAAGKNVLINPQTGTEAPTSWLPSAGVPSVAVCSHLWNNSVTRCPKDMISQFPFYLAPNYYGLWRRYHQRLHDFFKELPKELGERIITVQVSQGATGDLCPWHGNPVDPEYDVPGGANGERWKALWVNGTATMVEIWRDLSPTTKLLFNAVPPVNATEDQKPWPEYRHVIMDIL
eukprot:SAG31_NODE_9569_length_1257_cov_1.732297_2_plen_361_part_01